MRMEDMNDNEDYGMCCSKKMAERCARDYEEWERKDSRKELISIILEILIPTILLGILIVLESAYR